MSGPIWIMSHLPNAVWSRVPSTTAEPATALDRGADLQALNSGNYFYGL
jgi:hypothetical protein